MHRLLAAAVPRAPTHSFEDRVLRFERRLDLLLDDLEVGVGDGAELLERVEAEIAAEAEGLRAPDAEQSRERKLKERNMDTHAWIHASEMHAPASARERLHPQRHSE